MPISKKEVGLLNQRLQEIDGELHTKFGLRIKYADYEPRPSDLFEHYVLYNAALAVGPDSLKMGKLTRGDFRSSGILPFPGLKSYKTTWRMGETLAPDISILKEGKSVSFWFDKSLESGTRPDIVLRLGVFEVKRVDSPHTAVQLFREGELFAEYADIQLEQKTGFFVERQTMDWGPEGRRGRRVQADRGGDFKVHSVGPGAIAALPRPWSSFAVQRSPCRGDTSRTSSRLGIRFSARLSSIRS